METLHIVIIAALLLLLLQSGCGCGCAEGFKPTKVAGGHGRGGQSPRPSKSASGTLKYASLGITGAPGRGWHRGWSKNGGPGNATRAAHTRKPKPSKGWNSVDWEANEDDE